MTARSTASPDTTDNGLRPGQPYAAEIDAERRGWYEIVDLVRSLTPEECLEPGYQRDPDWTVRDVVAHLGTWLAEAQVQFERISAGTYEGHDVDIDALNAALLDAMRGQPWEVAWVQANAGRSRMVEEWWRLEEPSDESAWWIRKAGGEHYAEHLERLQQWTAELIDRRLADASTIVADPRGSSPPDPAYGSRPSRAERVGCLPDGRGRVRSEL